ncbi:hypothetical protein [Chitinimonas koreensis]|uniref:hypothetical protein n=1 Tax=Chitinimonas koreensis TaxID=356302 RepID=UPI0012F8DA4D|nr:hypothetical protein [Chitinimonas koreensis]
MEFVGQLDAEWDDGGFLGQLRRGVFSKDGAVKFLQLLKSIEIPDEAMVPKRALSLLWYLPSFLLWQRERVIELSGDAVAFDRFVIEVHNILEDVLGVP